MWVWALDVLCIMVYVLCGFGLSWVWAFMDCPHVGQTFTFLLDKKSKQKNQKKMMLAFANSCLARHFFRPTLVWTFVGLYSGEFGLAWIFVRGFGLWWVWALDVLCIMVYVLCGFGLSWVWASVGY
jgi:hypothetical protein